MALQQENLHNARELMQDIGRFFDVAAALSAFGAAGFWYRASVLKIPNPRAYFDYTPDTDPFVVEFKKASRYNSIAAFLAATSALIGGAKAIFL
jgi:hypothetical protein